MHDRQSYDAQTWQQIKTLLVAMLEAPVCDRPALLEGFCGHDSQLRGELESLLALERVLDTFLERPLLNLHAPTR